MTLEEKVRMLIVELEELAEKRDELVLDAQRRGEKALADIHAGVSCGFQAAAVKLRALVEH